MSPAHVVLIGGGFGGLTAAKTLRGQDVRVTLLDRRNHHVFQPLLYQVATATLSPGDIASPIRWIFRHQENLRVLLGEVEAIDTTARRVRLVDGAVIAYDYLIVLTQWVGLPLGALEREQNAAPDLERVLQRFQTVGVLRPLGVTEVGVARSRCS